MADAEELVALQARVLELKNKALEKERKREGSRGRANAKPGGRPPPLTRVKQEYSADSVSNDILDTIKT